MIPIARYVDAQLTAPGNGNTRNIQALGAPNATARVVVTAFVTAVVCRVEQSNSSTFATVDQRTQDFTFSANGNYEIDYQPRFQFVRFVFGSGAATINVTHEMFRLN
jgi:hypothetical protein